MATLQEVAAELDNALGRLPQTGLTEALIEAETAQTMLQGLTPAMEDFIGQVDHILGASGWAPTITGPTREALIKIGDAVGAFENVKLAITDAVTQVANARSAGSTAVSAIASGAMP